MTSRRTAAWLSLGLVALGIALQLRQYLANASLSLDESFLALNLLRRSFGEMFEKLDFNQGAPPAFLALQKTAVATIGKEEYALRLVPLLAACLAVALFPSLARRVLGDRAWATLFAVWLFVFSDPLIAYSSLNKQYSTDVSATVVGYWLVFRARGSLADPRALAPLVAYAILVPWVSFPSLFLLGAIALVLAARGLYRGWRAGVPGLVVGAASLVSWFGVYLVSIRKLGELQASLGKANAFIGNGGNGDTRAIGVGSIAGKVRYVGGFEHVDVWGYDLGRVAAALAGLLLVVGVIWLARRDLESVSLLVVPGILLAVAAAAGKYPLLGRTMLFLLPAIVLLVAEGAGVSTSQAARPWVRRAALTLCAAVAAAVAVAPLKHLVNIRTEEELKPVMTYLAEHQRPGDTLYVYYPSQYGFAYYLACNCAPAEVRNASEQGRWPARPAAGGPAQYAPALLSAPPRLVVQAFHGRDPRSYVSGLDRLRGRRRVWVLFSDIPRSKRVVLTHELDKLGQRVQTVRGGPDSSSAVVDLYDFSGRRH
jgi:hypothetical protein